MTKAFEKNYKQCDLIDVFLAGAAPKVGRYDLPQLESENYIPETQVLPFNYFTAAMQRAPCWYHCFVADDQFRRLYKNFWRYREILKYVSGMIGTDFSLFRDYDLETKIENCRKNRVVDYAIQQMGVPLIPTAGFADEETWSWCLQEKPNTKRPDLLVEKELLVEVKGMSSKNPGQVADNIKKAFTEN